MFKLPKSHQHHHRPAWTNHGDWVYRCWCGDETDNPNNRGHISVGDIRNEIMSAVDAYLKEHGPQMDKWHQHFLSTTNADVVINNVKYLTLKERQAKGGDLFVASASVEHDISFTKDELRYMLDKLQYANSPFGQRLRDKLLKHMETNDER